VEINEFGTNDLRKLWGCLAISRVFDEINGCGDWKDNGSGARYLKRKRVTSMVDINKNRKQLPR
jgi:hypothetical protein